MAVLLDIDGVLTVSWEPLPGAVEAVRELRRSGRPFALLTNTTSRTRAGITAALVGAGFPVTPDDVVTAPVLAAARLAGKRCHLLNSGDIREDLAGLELVDERPDVVLIGGAGPEFGYEALNRAFGFLQDGARLVALARNLSWQVTGGLSLDAGAFLLGLEAAARTEAEVIGKPSAAFFTAALDLLGAAPADSLMVGDDLDADVLGAQAAGLTGVLVRTGKYRPSVPADGADHVIGSIADLAGLLAAAEAGHGPGMGRGQ
ncbi:HAD-IIA family hydrolase [Actinocorallia longicatena]|uniref:HAD-IIA family hydrolase n=1 Tax=Actinocorallia longicatena TaxID=111803 RepID=A0ABP6Q3F0_9ACTN